MRRCMYWSKGRPLLPTRWNTHDPVRVERYTWAWNVREWLKMRCHFQKLHLTAIYVRLLWWPAPNLSLDRSNSNSVGAVKLSAPNLSLLFSLPDRQGRKKERNSVEHPSVSSAGQFTLEKKSEWMHWKAEPRDCCDVCLRDQTQVRLVRVADRLLSQRQWTVLHTVWFWPLHISLPNSSLLFLKIASHSCCSSRLIDCCWF